MCVCDGRWRWRRRRRRRVGLRAHLDLHGGRHEVVRVREVHGDLVAFHLVQLAHLQHTDEVQPARTTSGSRSQAGALRVTHLLLQHELAGARRARHGDPLLLRLHLRRLLLVRVLLQLAQLQHRDDDDVQLCLECSYGLLRPLSGARCVVSAVHAVLRSTVAARCSLARRKLASAGVVTLL